MIFLTDSNEGPLIAVCAQPNASKTRVIGIYGKALKIAVQAPPVDGAANEEIAEFLAELLDIPGRQVTLRRGATSRKKAFLLSGLTLESIRTRLEGKIP
ncbi:MAG: DUF167 domain-containing protein [Bdellovibrionota bacterium]